MSTKSASKRNKQVTLVQSTEVQDAIVAARVHQLFDLLQARMEQSNNGEMQMMVSMGMGMVQMALQAMSPGKLRQFVDSCEKILLVVGKWDLPQESYEQTITPLIIPLLESL